MQWLRLQVQERTQDTNINVSRVQEQERGWNTMKRYILTETRTIAMYDTQDEAEMERLRLAEEAPDSYYDWTEVNV